MAVPVPKAYQSNDTTELKTGTPINLGSVAMGSEGSPYTVNLWNNKGGASAVADMTNVKATIVTVNGYYTGDTVANGKNIVENKYIQIAKNDGQDTYLAVGGATMKTLDNIRGGILAAPGQPTGTPGSGAGSVPEGTYYYKISALDETGETLPGTESASVTVTSPNNQVALSWTAVPNAASYKIFRTTTSGTYTTPAQVGTSTTNSFTDTLSSPGEGAPRGAATVTHGHKKSILLKPVIPAGAATGAQAWNLRILYSYTE